MSDSALSIRRVPKQQRSRERYERILSTARELIAEKGNDNVSMRGIADACAVPISSVYQYFPDKNAVLWALMASQFDDIESDWLARLEEVTDLDALVDLSIYLFDRFVDLCHSDPCFSRLWRSVQANSVLSELDDALNQRIADATSAKLRSLGLSDQDNQLWLKGYLMASLSSTALQLAFANETLREDILHQFRELLRAQLSATA